MVDQPLRAWAGASGVGAADAGGTRPGRKGASECTPLDVCEESSALQRDPLRLCYRGGGGDGSGCCVCGGVFVLQAELWDHLGDPRSQVFGGMWVFKMLRALCKFGFICFCLKFSTSNTDKRGVSMVGGRVASILVIAKQYDVGFDGIG